VNQMIAYCGLVCTECPAYVATQAADRAALERVAAQWREEFDAPEITAEWVICDGCLGTTGRKCGHCVECAIRACAMEKTLVNCAHCDDYSCDKLGEFFGFVPEAQARLDGIRAQLVA
jgi:hypothetical protein